MAYMLLILEPLGQRAERSLEAGKQAYQQMLDFGVEMREQGVVKSFDSLQREGTRVQVREGRTRLLDGPFAEARELIGGYFLLDGVTREQALDWAARCPAAQWATVEVREIAPCYA